MTRHARTARLLAALGATAMLAPAASAHSIINRMFFPEQGSDFARGSDLLFFFIFWVSAFFFVLLMALMVYFCAKYRRRPGVPQQRSHAHNTVLELLWSGIPLLLMVVMFVWGARDFIRAHTSPANAETITVSAKKWAWTWEYPNGASSIETTTIADVEVPIFAIPQGRPVRFLMSSEDVIHSMYVPIMRKKIDVHPNRYTTMWFDARTVGDYHLFCAEYCGDQHSQMAALVRVLPPAEYDEWVAKQASTDSIPLQDLGRILYVTKGCNACHSVDGKPGTGPTWQGVYMKEHVLQSGETVVADENYLRQSILDPGSQLVAGYANQMPVYQGQLTDRELNSLIVYIMSLSEKGEEDVNRMIEEDEQRKAEEGGEPQASADTTN